MTHYVHIAGKKLVSIILFLIIIFLTNIFLNFTLGGELLNGILDIASSFGAEINGLNLFRTLFNESVKPFTRMLKLWIYLGRLEDNVGEFMVKLDDKLDKSALGNDFNSQYWGKNYNLITSFIYNLLLFVTFS